VAPVSRRRRLTIGLFCGAALAALVLLTVQVVRVGANPLDRELTLRLAGLSLPGGAPGARVVTFFGDSWFVYPAALLAAFAIARQGHVPAAFLFATAVVGAGVSESLLKLAVARPRPDLVEPLVHETTFSFPSGHAALAAAFFGGLAALVFHRTANRVARAAAVTGAVLAACAIALTRVILGVHWATDIAGGILIGLFWVAVLAGATPAAERRR
jgi:undecaprenyl-diphosphatase